VVAQHGIAVDQLVYQCVVLPVSRDEIGVRFVRHPLPVDESDSVVGQVVKL